MIETLDIGIDNKSFFAQGVKNINRILARHYDNASDPQELLLDLACWCIENDFLLADLADQAKECVDQMFDAGG